MDRTKQINLNHKIAVKIMEWYITKDKRWLRESNAGFTGYYGDPNTRFENMYWDPCTNACHAILLWKSKPFQDQAVWMQVYKPGVFRARVVIRNGQELFQKEQFYDIIRDHNGDQWVNVMQESAEMTIAKAADVIMDILHCTKLAQGETKNDTDGSGKAS